MPELPEVESIRLGLLKSIVSQKILNVEIRNEKIVSSNSNIRKADQNKTNNFIKNLIGKKIININRRAKNIIIEMDDASIILTHLKMTGQLIYNPFRLSGTFPREGLNARIQYIQSFLGEGGIRRVAENDGRGCIGVDLTFI